MNEEEQEAPDVVFNDVNEGEGQGAAEQQQQQASRDEEQISEEEIMSNWNQLEVLANDNPSVKETPEYKAILEQVQSMNGESEEKEGEEEAPSAESKGGDSEGAAAEDKEGEDEESDAFGLTKGGTKPNEKAIDFEVPEEMSNFITSNYGVEDPETFFTSVDKWRQQSQEGAQVRKDHDDILEGLKDLPSDIKAAITAHSNAEDYREVFNSTGSRLDFDTPFKSQDKEVIVQHYFKDSHDKLNVKLDKGDIDEDDYNERIEELYTNSKRSFSSDQKMIKDRRADMIASEGEFQEALRTSGSGSLDLLKEKYPNFGKSNLQRVKQHLDNGNIEDLFRKDDGTYGPRAAEMLALALYGDEVIDRLTKSATKKGASKATEKMVGVAAKKPRSKGAQQVPTDNQALDAISHLTGQFKKDPYS